MLKNKEAFNDWINQIITQLTNAVFWDATPCGSCKNRRFRGTYWRHHQGDKNRQARNNFGSN
jgi:hypothetical protein